METEPTTSGESAPATSAEDSRRQAVLAEYRKVLLQHKEQDAKVRSSKLPPANPLGSPTCCCPALSLSNPLPALRLAVRQEAKDLKKQYDKTEDDLRALQSVGQIIGEVLRQLVGYLPLG